MSCIASVDLMAGRIVHLLALHMQGTYAHHMEGPHTTVTNDRRIRGFQRKASDLFGRHPVVVIEPTRTTGRVIDGLDIQGLPVRHELLPRLCCIGEFESDAVPGADGCASGLIVVWFQEAAPPLPYEPSLYDMLTRFEWDEVAASYWY